MSLYIHSHLYHIISQTKWITSYIIPKVLAIGRSVALLTWCHMDHFCLTINCWALCTLCFEKCNRAQLMIVSSGHVVSSCPMMRCSFTVRAQEHQLLFFFFLTVPHSLRILSSLTRDWTQTLAMKAQILTTRPPANSQLLFFQWNKIFC